MKLEMIIHFHKIFSYKLFNEYFSDLINNQFMLNSPKMIPFSIKHILRSLQNYLPPNSNYVDCARGAGAPLRFVVRLLVSFRVAGDGECIIV